jgi:type II secretory pathway component GspD/PulD (secretin)
LTGGTLVVPDMRLNALFVQASQSNLDTIEQLLQVIDQPETPETQISPRPRIIQLYATDATEVANIVKAVYQEQTSAGSGQRQPSPQEFMQMMFQGRGGRGGRGGGNNNGGGGGGNSATDVQKMTIGVDTRNNCLIVSAPQPLYEEVEQLVRTLDQAIPTSPETTRVVTLKRANTESVQSAIAGLLGDSVQSSSNSRNNNNNNRNGGRNQNQGNQNFRQFGPGGFGGFGQGGFGGPGGFGGFGGPGGGGFGQGGRGQGGDQGGGGGRGNGGGGGNRGR